MHFLKEHIVFRFFALALALTLLLPTAVKFTHAFNHSKHEICLGKSATHLHKLDLDCKFYDFKLTTNYIFSQFYFNLFIPNTDNSESSSEYVFLSTYQQLHFSRRGPPICG